MRSLSSFLAASSSASDAFSSNLDQTCHPTKRIAVSGTVITQYIQMSGDAPGRSPVSPFQSNKGILKKAWPFKLERGR